MCARMRPRPIRHRYARRHGRSYGFRRSQLGRADQDGRPAVARHSRHAGFGLGRDHDHDAARHPSRGAGHEQLCTIRQRYRYAIAGRDAVSDERVCESRSLREQLGARPRAFANDQARPIPATPNVLGFPTRYVQLGPFPLRLPKRLEARLPGAASSAAVLPIRQRRTGHPLPRAQRHCLVRSTLARR